MKLKSVRQGYQNKVKSHKRHAKRRAFERYGIQITGTDISKIRRIIRTGKADSIKKCSNSRSVYLVLYRDIQWKVVYSRTMKTIITILPLGRGE